MSKKVDLAKYQEMNRFLRVLMKTFYIASLAGSVIAFITGFIFLILPSSSSIFEAGVSTSLNLTIDGVLRYKLNTAIGPENIKPIMTTIMFMICVLAATLAPIFKQLYLILETIKDNRPFASENVNRLSTIGIVLIIAPLVTRFAEGLVMNNMIDSLKLSNIEINNGPNGTMILMGFIMFILSGVFKYGCYLQKEYDSTV